MKKVLSMLLALTMVLILLPTGVFSVSAATSGTTGDCTWSVKGSVLTISGKGEMGSYFPPHVDTPWVGFTKVVIEDGVTSIGNHAFYGVVDLENVVIPDSVTKIGDYAFFGCQKLASIHLPDSIVSIGERAFMGTALERNATNWENHVLYVGNHLIKANDTLKGAYTIKAGTKSIAEKAFFRCYQMTSVSIPGSIQIIDIGAFDSCYYMTKVTLKKGVKTIKSEAFTNCWELTQVSLPSTVTSIGNNAFAGCEKLAAITLPDRTDLSIGEQVFTDTAFYKKAENWTNGVLYIGDHLIRAKETLSGSYTIRKGTKTIAQKAFFACDGVTKVTISSGIKTIPYATFSSCTSLTTVRIPDTVNQIESDAFACTGITEITIPAAVKNIGTGAFDCCINLKHVTIPYGITTLSYATFYGCSELVSVTIPSSVTTINSHAFAYCSKLKHIWYTGTKKAWSKVQVNSYNNDFSKVTLHFDICKNDDHQYENEGASCKSCTWVQNDSLIVAVKPSKTTYYQGDKLSTKNMQLKRTYSNGSQKTVTSGWKATADLQKTGSKVKVTVTYDGKKTSYTVTVKELSSPQATVSNVSKGVKVSWKKVTGADKYIVYRRIGTGSYKKIKTTSSLSFTDTGVKAGQNCNYRVCAVNGSYTGKYKTTATLRRLTAPSSLKLTKATKGFKVTWSKVTGAKKYEVYRRTGSGSWKKVKTTSSRSFTDKSAAKGKYYTYRVRAVYGDSDGVFKTGKKTKR